MVWSQHFVVATLLAFCRRFHVASGKPAKEVSVPTYVSKADLHWASPHRLADQCTAPDIDTALVRTMADAMLDDGSEALDHA